MKLKNIIQGVQKNEHSASGRIQNILLVEPKSPDFNIYSLFKIPRMGLVILGTLARQAGYNVRIIYQQVTPLTYKHILWADVVGFSIITSTAPEGYRLAQMVRALCKQKNKNTPIVFGGVHATFEPDEGLKYGDFLFRGEAEQTFVPFLNALKNLNVHEDDNLLEDLNVLKDHKEIQAIPGLSWKTHKGIHHNPIEKQRIDMNQVPSPDWSLFVNYKPTTGIVMTSRGCPHNCNFCSVTPMLGRTYRMRSESLIIKDMAALKNKHVFFYDDNFAAHRARTKKLLKRIIEERHKTHHVENFSAQVRVEIARDPELLDLMKEAGFKTFYIGFESIDPKTLELYNKNQTINDIQKAVREIHKRGIAIHGMFIFGSDADGKATFKETLKFVKHTKIETVQFLIITPLPGTEHYKKLDDEGRILCHEWERYDAFNAVFLPRKMSPYQLQVWTIKTMKRFYTLSRVLKNLITGKLWFTVLYAYGWLTLLQWSLNNRKKIKKLREDSRKIFIPEFLKTYCPVLHH